jgi:predicted amidohydrolase YtcJ
MLLTGLIVDRPGAASLPATLRLCGTSIEAVSPAVDVPHHAPHILPGFIDAHTHPLETGLEMLSADLRGACCLEEVTARLRAHRSRRPDEELVLGFNLEPDRLQDRRYPTAAELDSALSDVPALVYRVDGHSAVLNSPGLQMLSGEAGCGSLPADGLLRGQQYELASRVFKSLLRPNTIREALLAAGGRAATAGVTSLGAFVGSDGLDDSRWRLLLDVLGAAAVRAVPYIQTWDTRAAERFGLDRVGGCLLIDGSFGSRTAALQSPYSDDVGNSGICYEPDDRLTCFYRAAEERRLQTAVHAIGDRAVRQVVRCMAESIDPANRLRHRIEHAELLTAELPAVLSARGVVLGCQPSFETEWGGPDRMYAARLGERWRSTNPFRTLLDLGVVVAGGSDSPITPIEPIAGIAAARHHPNREQRVTADEALAFFTTAAAYALGIDDVTGRIDPGLDADLVLLTSDPRLDPPPQVLATIKQGKVVFATADPSLRGRLPAGVDWST